VHVYLCLCSHSSCVPPPSLQRAWSHLSSLPLLLLIYKLPCLLSSQKL
jgi:hypothetical protein